MEIHAKITESKPSKDRGLRNSIIHKCVHIGLILTDYLGSNAT